MARDLTLGVIEVSDEEDVQGWPVSIQEAFERGEVTEEEADYMSLFYQDGEEITFS